MSAPTFIAVDWGTTNRRAYRISAGEIIAVDGGRGAAMLSPADYPGELVALRERLGELPVLMAGMVGSNIGWREVSYVPAPADLATIAEGVLWIDARTAIIPGVSYRDDTRADIMRGEEVQLLGVVAKNLVPPDALLCQPGTHCKWAKLEQGRIAHFRTAMTGELFGLLSQHGLLARQLVGPVSHGPEFRLGVREGSRRDLAASLFGVRAFGNLGRRDDRDSAAFVSGLLIGADVAARLAEFHGDRVYILADPGLGGLYAGAIESLGGKAELLDSTEAFVSGVSKLWDLIT